VKDENGDLFADSHNILNKWENYFFQILNVCIIFYVRQTEMHAAEPLLPEPSCFEVEIAIAKLKRCKSPGTDQILAELIQTGGNTLCSEIQKHTASILNKEKLLQQWKESIIVPIYRKCDKIFCSNSRGISL